MKPFIPPSQFSFCKDFSFSLKEQRWQDKYFPSKEINQDWLIGSTELCNDDAGWQSLTLTENSWKYLINKAEVSSPLAFDSVTYKPQDADLPS